MDGSSDYQTNALAFVLAGLGARLAALGPYIGLYGVGLGSIGLAASWLVGVTLRICHTGTAQDSSCRAFS